MRRQLARAARLAAMLAVAAMMIGGVACSSDANKDSKGGSASSTKATVDTSGAITLVAKDNLYEPKQFTGPAGQAIMVKLDNQGAAIHNFQIKDEPGADGQDIQTPLLNAKQTGSIGFTLPAGKYDFFCSVHPVEMRGTLTLQ